MDSTDGGCRGLPKLRELFRRQRRDSETMNESPDLEFSYGDADFYDSEIAELYCYTEEPEFHQNLKSFQETFASEGYEQWTTATDTQQRKFVVFLQNELDVADMERRMNAIQAVLYLVQDRLYLKMEVGGEPVPVIGVGMENPVDLPGHLNPGVFGECENEENQQYWSKKNVYLLYDLGLFTSFVQLLHLEMENKTAASAALRKAALSIADSKELRLILNVLYTVVETMRLLDDEEDEEEKSLKKRFRHELTTPYIADEILPVTLFGMVTRFGSGSAPHFPMKKVLLLLWKVVLVCLGGLRELQDEKNRIRTEHSLPALPEDPYEVCKKMRASSPPASAADLIEQQLPKRSFRGKRSLLKQTSLDDSYENNGNNGSNNERSADDDLLREVDMKSSGSDDEMPPKPPRPSTPTTTPKCLPWKPKVRLKDLEMFLDHTRSKFVGFQVKSDHTSLAGLPQPIHEGVKVLRQHLYISLSEVQIKREEEIARNPLSKPEKDIPYTPSELLYQALLPSLPQYMIALLKILLAAAPTSKAKTDSINILADVLPNLTNDQEAEVQNIRTTVLQSMKLEVDVNRHKEIIVKAISGLLLLLLKHFKLNHIYQFEFMSQHLVFANCIPLVLKFFNQNIMSYVGTKNNIVALDFPSCVIGEQIEITTESLENGDSQVFCWRNLFSCINLLRILNKLTKWKHSRTMMLVVFKSAPILKRALKVKQSMMQLYVLKLLKMQTKYLGRQWRKSNMKTMSAIYQKVRHRLNDDWAFGNDLDAKPWDFQAEECALRACVDRFNNRRYGANGTDPDFKPVDNCILSVLGQKIELSEEFKRNYEYWLNQEVFSNQVDWDEILRQ